MSISVQAKTDYTPLLTSATKKVNTAALTSVMVSGTTANANLLEAGDMANLTKTVLGASSDSSSLLTDYAAIKNGSYGKLIKAYVRELEASEKSSSAEEKDSAAKESEPEKTMEEKVEQARTTYAKSVKDAAVSTIDAFL